MVDLLEAARAEEKQLLERLKAVRELIRAYGGAPESEPQDFAPEPQSQATQRLTRTPTARNQQILALVRERLKGLSEPTPTREILAFLEEKGFEIAGKVPVSTLSAMLGRADGFEPVGRRGWRLTYGSSDSEKPSNESASEGFVEDREGDADLLDRNSGSDPAHPGESCPERR